MHRWAVVAIVLPVLSVVDVAVATPLEPSERWCFDVSGHPGDVALVNLTPIDATAPGNGQLISSNVADAPVASNVNFGPGTIDPNVGAAEIGTDGSVCFVNSANARVNLLADHLGSFSASTFATAGAPVRRVDTRVGLGGDILEPSERLCFDVEGEAGDVAMVNLLPVEARAAGFGALLPDSTPTAPAPSTPPMTSNVNFAPGSFDPNVALAAVGASGQVCFSNSVHARVHLVADEIGTIKGVATTPAAANGLPKRVVDTRLGIGGGMIVPSGRACFAVAGSPGDVALVNLTPVSATRGGFGQLVSSDVTHPPVASNVNFGVGTFDPNVAAAVIGANGQVCFVNSEHAAVHLVADHLISIDRAEYTPPSPTGALVRVLDTRPLGTRIHSDTTLAPTAIDCATTDSCVAAVGSQPVRGLTITGDGASVTLGAAPAATAVATWTSAMECSSADKCIAVGTSDLTIDGRLASLGLTTDRGRTWTVPAMPRAIDGLNDVTCASSLRCLTAGFVETAGVIDGVLFVTTNGGTSWSEITLPNTVDQVEAIDCPSGTLCLMIAKDAATGQGSEPSRILRSTDAGGTWTTVSLPTGFPSELACPTPTTCLAFTGGTSAARHLSTDGGISWTSQPWNGNLRVDHVECPALDRCIAAPGSLDEPRPGTSNVLVSTDLFATWTTRFVTSGGTGSGAHSIDVSCTSPSACFVTGWYEGGAGGFMSRVSIT